MCVGGWSGDSSQCLLDWDCDPILSPPKGPLVRAFWGRCIVRGHGIEMAAASVCSPRSGPLPAVLCLRGGHCLPAPSPSRPSSAVGRRPDSASRLDPGLLREVCLSLSVPCGDPLPQPGLLWVLLDAARSPCPALLPSRALLLSAHARCRAPQAVPARHWGLSSLDHTALYFYLPAPSFSCPCLFVL